MDVNQRNCALCVDFWGDSDPLVCAECKARLGDHQLDIEQIADNRLTVMDGPKAGNPPGTSRLQALKARIKDRVKETTLKPKLLEYAKWRLIDKRRIKRYGLPFNQKYYGLTLFCGQQGCGKTASMVHYLEQVRAEYPNCWIITNFGYVHQDRELGSWDDLFNLHNGTDGILFAIDELQNEWSSGDHKDFPISILSVVTQQRKNAIKIVGTSQVFKRVVVQLREQATEVAECKTFAGRWTWCKCFNGEDYNTMVESISEDKRAKVPRKWRFSFVQTDKFRELYDSYSVVERVRKNIEKIKAVK